MDEKIALVQRMDLGKAIEETTSRVRGAEDPRPINVAYTAMSRLC